MKLSDLLEKREKIAVIGLGYVGLPLAVEFSKKLDVIGFDRNEERIAELKMGIDNTHEVDNELLAKTDIRFTNDPGEIRNAGIVIIAVPTPIDRFNIPDTKALINATRTAGRNLRKGSVVIYESTVYPGLTEEECVPVLEEESGLAWKKDFFVGYSPERVNPGDREHTIDKIVKVVSGDTDATADLVEQLYALIIKAGVYRVSSIKTAEAAKVIENTQRDLNIAFMNELSIIFHKMDIDTREVLRAAGTKWNFLRFEPGLVGGHCIGVDPYYLTFRAESLGYHPQVILSGRKINNSMGKFIAENTVKKIIKADKNVHRSKILILGFTFKENIPDIRNTRVIDIYEELIEYGACVDIYDPLADAEEAGKHYGIRLLNKLKDNVRYDAIISAVKHDIFLREFTIRRLKGHLNGENSILIDIKGIYDKKEAESMGIIYWGL